MNWISFKNEFSRFWCFDTNQVYACYPDFDRNNLVRWTKNGYLVRLRKSMYAFAECQSRDGAATYFAGRMHKPSYVSLHTALSFYGMIPEAVLQVTSVTSLKTASFKNAFGEFSYKSVREDMMFGYEPKEAGDGLFVQYATPEKALVDLLYLYPSYNTKNEIMELRLDEGFLHTGLDASRLDKFILRAHSSALEKSFGILRKAYRL